MPGDTQGDAVLAELQEANRWLRIMAEPILRERLLVNLRDAAEKRVYQASTGGSTRDVEHETGVSKSTVATMWSRWAGAGIMQPTGVPGRFRRLIDLATLGIEA